MEFGSDLIMNIRRLVWNSCGMRVPYPPTMSLDWVESLDNRVLD